MAADRIVILKRDGSESAAVEPDSPPSAIAWTSDGSALLVADLTGSVRLWEPGAARLQPDLDTARERTIGWNGLISAGPVLAHLGSGSVRMVNSGSDSARTLFSGDTNRSAFALDAQGKAVLTGGSTGKLEIYPVGDGSAPRVIPFPAHVVTALAFSPDGSQIVAGDFTGGLWILDLATGKPVIAFTGDKTEILGLSFRTDGKLEAVASTDNQVLRSSLSPDESLWRGALAPAGCLLGVVEAQYLDEGKTLAVSGNLCVALFDIQTRKLQRTFENQSVWGWPFACDGRARCAWQGTSPTGSSLLLWVDVLSQDAAKREIPIDAPALDLILAGKYLAAATASRKVRIWEMATGMEVPVIEMKSPSDAGFAFSYDPVVQSLSARKLFVPVFGVVTALAASSDGRWLAAANSVDIKVCDTAAIPFRCFELPFEYGASTLALSGSTVFWVDSRRNLNRWDFRAKTKPQITGTLSELARRLVIRADGRAAAVSLQGGGLELWDLEHGVLLATVAIRNDAWLVATPEGLFDSSEAGWRAAAWRFPGSSSLSPVEAYFQDFYHPDLVAELLAGDRPHPAKSLSRLDRSLPRLQIDQTALTAGRLDPTPSGVGVERTLASVQLRITATPAAAASAVFDLRVMLNGSLVQRFDGEWKPGPGGLVKDVALPMLPGSNEVRAYAFNRSGVKSLDAVWTLPQQGYGYMRTQPILRVLAIGINRYRNPSFNLRFAQDDAELLKFALDQPESDLQKSARQLNDLFNADMMNGQRQGEEIASHVRVTTLLNEQATKFGILAALQTLARETKPEDAVLIFFAGHGVAKGQHYYLLPYDMAWMGAVNSLNARALDAIAASSVSDSDLERELAAINPKHLGMILDSCQSGKLLEGERPRGPLNGSGFARLIYEKGMYLIAASQGYQAAMEENSCGHGLLSCALIQEGLIGKKADFDPRDGRIDLAEWFRFAETRVPELSRGAGGSRGAVALDTTGKKAIVAQQPAFVPRATPSADKLIIAVVEPAR